MSDRITLKDLEAVCARINRTVNGTDETPVWTRNEDGTLTATIGVYTLDGAYGGWELHRISNEAGGVSDVFRCGHVPKSLLYSLMQAFLTGYEAYRDDLVRLQS